TCALPICSRFATFSRMRSLVSAIRGRLRVARFHQFEVGTMKSYLAEVLGTFLLVFIGCAAIVMGGLGDALPLGQVGIGLAFGLGLVAAAYAIGPISGAHLNPAVTLGFF